MTHASHPGEAKSGVRHGKENHPPHHTAQLRKIVSLTIDELQAKGKPVVRDEKSGIVTVEWRATGRTTEHDIEWLTSRVTAKDSNFIQMASRRRHLDLAMRLELAEIFLVLDLAWEFRNERASQMPA